MTASTAATASSGIVLGVVMALILWFFNLVDPTTMIYLMVVLGLSGGAGAGVPAYILHHKITRVERRFVGSPSPAPPYTPVQYPAPTQPAAQPVASFSVGSPSAPPPASAPPTWPLFEPLCVAETGEEKELLGITAAAGLPPSMVLIFLTQTQAGTLPGLGLGGIESVRISRVEGEDVVSPGDLDRIGYIIEKHFSKGQGYKVVLPSVESLVEAAGLKNVRRLLDVARDLSQSSHGSMLFSLEPKALSPDQVTILERGAFRVLRSHN